MAVIKPSARIEPVSATSFKWLVALCWFAAVATLAVVVFVFGSPVGWDSRVYQSAIETLRAGGNPYLEGLAANQASAHPPLTYAYGPLTLPLLRWLGHLPVSIYGTLFWLAYVVGAVVPLAVARLFLYPAERQAVRCLAPFSLLFPGLLALNVVLSGNIVYLLYGAIFYAAWLGWRRNSWALFYVMVVAACCVKPHLLTLLAIPLFSATRQLRPAVLTGTAGGALLASQRWLFPSATADYARYMNAMLHLYDRQLGLAPVGMLAEFMRRHGTINPRILISFFCGYAGLLLFALWQGSRLYKSGRISFERWLPVLLTGVALLNPRLVDYDLSPITIPMGLIAWRGLMSFTHSRYISLAIALTFLCSSSLLGNQWPLAKPVLLAVLLGLFSFGSWELRRCSGPETGINPPA